MKCPECLGTGEIEWEDKFGFPMNSSCSDCKGSGEIITEDRVGGNDCPNNSCS